MNRNNLLILGIVLLGLGAAIGAGAMWWVLGSNAEPSQPISAPTLSLEEETDEPDASGTEIAALRAAIDEALGQEPENDSTRAAAISALGEEIGALEEQVALLSTASAGAESMDEVVSTEEAEESADTATATPVPTASPAAEDSAAAAQQTAGDSLSGRGLFRIDSELSEVRFIINEELFGNPKEVIGSTNQVAGDIIVNFDAPSDSQVGEIRINARTLETDDENRNRAIRNQILQSRLDEFEFTSFVPTQISGMPEAVALGETVNFEVTGDLTVRHITSPVTFDVTATLVAEDRLEGTASALVTRDVFELNIPRAPGVANVSNEVGLEIDFVAMQVEE